MAKQLVTGIQARLKFAAHEFVEAQRAAGKPNDQPALIVRAAKRLGDGWSESSLKTALGLKTRKSADQLPHMSSLVRFCEMAGVSTEWLFAEIGPMKRSATKELTSAQLADVLAAHMVARCSAVYNEPLRCDATKLLELLTSYVVATAKKDAAAYAEWRSAHEGHLEAGRAILDYYESMPREAQEMRERGIAGLKLLNNAFVRHAPGPLLPIEPAKLFP